MGQDCPVALLWDAGDLNALPQVRPNSPYSFWGGPLVGGVGGYGWDGVGEMGGGRVSGGLLLTHFTAV